MLFWKIWAYNKYVPDNIYLLKVNNKNTKNISEICSKFTIKTPERHDWRCSDVFIINFERTSHFFSSISIVNFDK